MDGCVDLYGKESKTTRLGCDSFLVLILVVGGFRGNVQGGRGEILATDTAFLLMSSWGRYG